MRASKAGARSWHWKICTYCAWQKDTKEEGPKSGEVWTQGSLRSVFMVPTFQRAVHYEISLSPLRETEAVNWSLQYFWDEDWQKKPWIFVQLLRVHTLTVPWKSTCSSRKWFFLNWPTAMIGEITKQSHSMCYILEEGWSKINLATRVDLVSWAAFFHAHSSRPGIMGGFFFVGVVATLAVQVREGFYRDHYSANVFLALVK